MDNTVKIEIYIFLTSIYGGLIAGLAYDIYRINRNYFKPRKIATMIEDFLFWIGIGFIFFYMLNKNNLVQLRLYVFLGFFLGGVIYLKVLSILIMPLLLKVFNGLTSMLKGIRKLIVWPFKAIGKFLRSKSQKFKRLKRIFKEASSERKRHRKIFVKKK